MAAAAILVMKLQGPNGAVNGECPMERFKDWITLDSWKWIVNASEESLRPGKISITKECDRASPTMMQFLDASTRCPSAELMLWEGSEDSNLELQVVLTDVELVSYRVTAKNEDKGGGVDESWDLDYKKINFRYYSPEADAADVKSSTFVEAGFDAHKDGTGGSADDSKRKEFESYFAKLDKPEREKMLGRLKEVNQNPKLAIADSDAGGLGAQRKATLLRDQANATGPK